MCTIICLSIDTQNIKCKEIQNIVQYVENTLPVRGRDGFGCEFFIDGERYEEAFLRTKNFKRFISLFELYINESIQYTNKKLNILLQSRAIPETEENVDIFEYQPVYSSDKKVFLCHNGLIHNDKEIIEQISNRYRYTYDSQVIPELISYYLNKNKNINDVLRNTYNKLKGSFSIIISVINDLDIYYMVNYQPLYLIENYGYKILANVKPYTQHMEIEPYSLGKI